MIATSGRRTSLAEIDGLMAKYRAVKLDLKAAEATLALLKALAWQEGKEIV